MIGINALVAPFYDPLRLAEDIAVVDQLSNGRLGITLGAGYVPDEFAMFDVPTRARAARMTETVETLRSLDGGAVHLPRPNGSRDPDSLPTGWPEDRDGREQRACC
jgi:alkanesulfonate monooxygenase SsuD/methylene tetrahydromethanopterin reductase-like flavin-dependent oxidoreductase (luciferase family)